MFLAVLGVIWARYIYLGPSDNQWKQAEIAVSAQVEYIMFEAVRGGRSLAEPFGDTALDGIEVWTDCSDGRKPLLSLISQIFRTLFLIVRLELT